jgi:hypothetical protein
MFGVLADDLGGDVRVPNCRIPTRSPSMDVAAG